ncbi:hypothetical protein B0O80DRAFT_153915 [Mortierella sp. GBAus27b]|nr:hypothetical protein B0O80DRAFT_153915 [Mortierella sp. GBAus27b]
MVVFDDQPLSGTSPQYLHSAGSGKFRTFGRRRLSKTRYRVLMIVYLALGCVIPYYVMKIAEEEQQQGQVGQQDEQVAQGSTIVDENNPRGYRTRAYFRDLNDIESSHPPILHPFYQQQQNRHDWHPTRSLLHDQVQQHQADPSNPSASLPDTMSAHIQFFHQQQKLRQKEILANLNDTLALHRKKSKLSNIQSPEMYEALIQKVLREARDMVSTRMPEEFLVSEKTIPGTDLDTVAKTRHFRQLMDQALNKGRWVHEPDRDYPDFGGATGWNKKMKNERDRDVSIDRQPFPEAGKYHWEPTIDNLPPWSAQQGEEDSESGSETEQMAWTTSTGWHATRILREDFCTILGPRHIVLVGDLIHWQLHDSIMYNMFDTPQVCYGDLSCYLGTGHPLCPPPNDVRLKFVRNDLLSSTRPSQSRRNETKSQDPVEMPWLRDARVKGTVILGATHQTMPDKVFTRRLIDTMVKIRKGRPDALIIYRNNPVGHPDCPSKANGFNSDRDQWASPASQDDIQGKGAGKRNLLAHDRTTFAAAAKPFEDDIPLAEMLDYPLNWSHYDRQNQIAKVIVEAAGGIYWNVATMTNMRPDGHVGGQDCLSYKRPGPTDEWAVSLYNLFKTIDLVEKDFE